MSAATKRTSIGSVEVIIVDIHTAEPIGIGAEHRLSAIHDAELYQAETKTPEGPAALLHEHRVWPRMMAVLALAGLLIVGVMLYLREGASAAALGIAWLSMGYAVAWIVVWAAGLARSREEIALEQEIEQRHRQG